MCLPIDQPTYTNHTTDKTDAIKLVKSYLDFNQLNTSTGWTKTSPAQLKQADSVLDLDLLTNEDHTLELAVIDGFCLLGTADNQPEQPIKPLDWSDALSSMNYNELDAWISWSLDKVDFVLDQSGKHYLVIW